MVITYHVIIHIITTEYKELALQFQLVHQMIQVIKPFAVFNHGHHMISEFCLSMSGVKA
jgi:hypothetical protein